MKPTDLEDPKTTRKIRETLRMQILNISPKISRDIGYSYPSRVPRSNGVLGGKWVCKGYGDCFARLGEGSRCLI